MVRDEWELMWDVSGVDRVFVEPPYSTSWNELLGQTGIWTSACGIFLD